VKITNLSDLKQAVEVPRLKVGVVVSLVLLFATSASPRALGQYHYTLQRVNPPGATFSSALGLNNNGVVVGTFELAGGTLEGFAYDGIAYRTLVFPGSVYTEATGVNDSGTVVGLFQGPDGFTHGYLLNDHKFMQYDVNIGVVSTYIYGINNAGNFVGVAGNDGANQGFVSLGGIVTQFTFNGSVTSAVGINSNNEIVGTFIPPPFSTWHGYYRDASGKMTQIDYPGAAATACLGINDLGEITGSYLDTNNVSHGFVTKNGKFRAAPSLFPDLGQSNNAGSFVGYYFGKNQESYGYLAKRFLQTQ
jgi:probable HAF family extracellular repeat protein